MLVENLKEIENSSFNLHGGGESYKSAMHSTSAAQSLKDHYTPFLETQQRLICNLLLCFVLFWFGFSLVRHKYITYIQAKLKHF